jgi:hypothetical protein
VFRFLLTLYIPERVRSFYTYFTTCTFNNSDNSTNSRDPPPLPIYLLLIHISRGPYQMVWHIIVTVIVYTQFGLTADFIEVQCRIFLACIAGLSEEYKKENVCIWFWANINVYDHVLLNLHSLRIWYSVLCAFQFANIITSRACASKSMSLCLSEQHNFTNIQIPCLFWYIVRPTKTDIV